MLAPYAPGVNAYSAGHVRKLVRTASIDGRAAKQFKNMLLEHGAAYSRANCIPRHVPRSAGQCAEAAERLEKAETAIAEFIRPLDNDAKERIKGACGDFERVYKREMKRLEDAGYSARAWPLPITGIICAGLAGMMPLVGAIGARPGLPTIAISFAGIVAGTLTALAAAISLIKRHAYLRGTQALELAANVCRMCGQAK